MKISLLRRDPIAIRLIIGSSRSAVIPCTYCGVTAVSSITTPAAFAVARPVAAPMSSTEAAASLARAAMSSRSPNRPALIASSPWHRRLPVRAHEPDQHVLGDAVLHRINPHPAVDRAATRPGPDAAGNGHVAADLCFGQQVENRTGVTGFEVGDGYPHIGPHAVVPAARRQPVGDAELRQVVQRPDLCGHATPRRAA